MLELLRNFLSGKRVIVIAILLAIPFIFFGSTSFGTTFTSFGSVNGEPVTQKDINLASSQVNQRLQSVYGEEFNLDDLEESVSIELIKNEIINQKTLLSKAKDLGLSVSIKEAKKEIIKAEEVLRDLLIIKNRDPGLWMQLSEVQRAGKNIVGYHLSRGEYYLLIGDFDNALNQFQFALRLSGNSFQTSETIMTKIKFAQERLGNKRGF